MLAGSKMAPSGRGLVFLYRLTEGHVAPSFGVHCARLAGVPATVLDRAEAVMANIAAGQAVPRATHERTRRLDAQFTNLAVRLLAVDAGDVGEVRALLAAVAAAAGGA